MDVEAVAARLYPYYSPDAVHEAIVALLARTESPENPLAFCRRVAKRYQARPWTHTRAGARRCVVLADQGSALFGVDEGSPERVALAREVLNSLHPVDIEIGMGYLDPPVEDTPEGRSADSRARAVWRKRQARRSRREVTVNDGSKNTRTED